MATPKRTASNKIRKPVSAKAESVTATSSAAVKSSKLKKSSDISDDLPSKIFENYIVNSGPIGNEYEWGPRMAIYLVQRIALEVRNQTSEIAAKYNIHVSDLYVILLLHRAQPDCIAPAADLQKALSFTAGGMTRRLDRLHEMGLIERIAHPDNRRAWLVQLTEAGKTLTATIRSSRQPNFVDPHSELSDKEWQTLVKLLQRVNNKLTDNKNTSA